MKEKIKAILNSYLEIFKDEQERQKILITYLNNHDDKEITDWNNFDGHLVAGGFIYSTLENKFLVLYHKDLKMYLYPGGHMTNNDSTPLEAAIREIKEETNIENLTQLTLTEDKLIPLDIDTHLIEYNERLNLPKHYHFDFRYLFITETIENIIFDEEELSDYRWIDIEELENDVNYGKIASKVKKILNK